MSHKYTLDICRFWFCKENYLNSLLREVVVVFISYMTLNHINAEK
jgi:hypothetical protein